MRVRSQQTPATSAADALLASTSKQVELAPAQTAAERAALVNGVGAPRGGGDTRPEMDFGELAHRLKEAGLVGIKLGHISQWSLVQRLQARAWLETSGMDDASRPEHLAQFLITVKTDGGGTVVTIPQTGPAIAPEPRPFPNVPDPPKPTVSIFVTANKGPGITPDYARIIESVYAVDAFKDYTDLETNLEVGEQRGDYHTLREHLDKAEQRARRAHRLFLGAQLERSNWERDAEVTNAAMRGEAHAELEAEKEAGERRKMITDADVTSRVAEKFPDEWRAQETTRRKLKGVESTIEHLAERWNSKCVSLRTLLETLRK